MSEENNNENAEQTNVEQPIDYKAKYEEAQKAIDALVAKKEQLLKETKDAKEEKRRQSQIAEEERQKQLEAAQKNGEFEKLWQNEQEQNKQLAKKLEETNKRHRDSNINLVAKEVAFELAKNDVKKAGLLSEFLAQSISKVADDYGQIDHEVLGSIKKEFETNERYAPLLASNQSHGSGAPGNNRSAGLDNKITRAEFAKLSPEKQMDVVNKGRQIID